MLKWIETPCGKIRGTTSERSGVIAYKGIRYATAGRWEYPKLVEHWDGIYDAVEFGNCCYQPRAFVEKEENEERIFYNREFRDGVPCRYDEDCLFLNIWVPEDAEPDSKLPVLFYIHGGGFTGGCGHELHYNTPVWPSQGVIAVTMHYRLGPLGFLCLPELEEEAGHTGNYGLFDQLAALQWVQKNITAFGGDPQNVTVLGQSAGAMSIQLMSVSPLTDGLFAKAVMSSGGGVNKIMEQIDIASPVEQQYLFWQRVMEKSGCTGLAELRSLEPARLFEAWEEVKKEDPQNLVTASPCLDHVFLTEKTLDAARNGKQKNIPYMIGSTRRDFMPPVNLEMAADWCKLQEEQGKQPSYAWFFERNLPGDDRGAWHSSDLWYWFDTLENSWRPMTDRDYELSRQMSTYLTNFAKTGDPNGEALPEWIPTTKERSEVLCLGDERTQMKKTDNIMF